jgi:hypothetical protein
MKELITEEQAGLIVLILSIAVTVVSLLFALYQSRKTQKSKLKGLWAQAVLCALIGPVIWAFWGIYNSIENYYGLDSLKALEINLCIAIGLGVVFVLLFHYVPGWLGKKQAAPRRK